MEMADRDREGIGSIQGDAAPLSVKQRENHSPHLRLVCLAVAHQGFLDEPRLVFKHRNPAARGRGEQHSPGMRELQGGEDVLSQEDGLDRYGGRLTPLEQAACT